ncbi:MAG: hypothetical protein ABJ327_12580 [Litoreibacter sp.]
MSNLIQPIQIVLVYDNASVFDQFFGDLLTIEPRLKTALQDYGSWNSLSGYNTPNHLGLATDIRHVTLQRYDEQMELDGFADILANPLVTNLRPKIAEAIQKHQRAFLIEVGCGSSPGFAKALALPGLSEALGGLESLGMGLSDDQAGYEDRLRLAQRLACAMIDELAPSAVHWVQSQQVFDGATFKAIAGDGFSLPLYCGPFLFGGKQLSDGSVMAGVRALGSQNILGKMVMFKPDVQDWSESYTQILAFIAYCRSIGRVLEDNETFSADTADAPVYRVTHKNDVPQLPDGYIELSVDGRDLTGMQEGFFRRLLRKFWK